jgi:hypothetical protein
MSATSMRDAMLAMHEAQTIAYMEDTLLVMAEAIQIMAARRPQNFDLDMDDAKSRLDALAASLSGVSEEATQTRTQVVAEINPGANS